MRRMVILWILIFCIIQIAWASDYTITPYGFIKFETIYDNTEIAKGDWMLFAYPGDSPKADQSIFTMNARHTRLGMKLQGPAIGQDGVIKGLIEVDFAGGFPNSTTAARQPQLRLRHAWAEINKPGWELRFGQDWALIAAPFPNTTSFVVGAGKGNLWMRYPQIKYTLKTKAVNFAISLNRPMAGNIKYEDNADGDFDPVGDGERSALPWIMGRADVKMTDATFSLSGHYGQEQINDDSNVAHDVTSWSVNSDLILTTGPVKWTASAFMGENLNSFFGGIFQGFTRDATSVSNIAAMGGWGEAVIKLNPNWALTLGGGMDDPEDKDLMSGMRSKNDWIFGNIAYTVAKGVTFMLETDYMKTSYLEGKAGENLRMQFVTYLKF